MNKKRENVCVKLDTREIFATVKLIPAIRPFHSAKIHKMELYVSVNLDLKTEDSNVEVNACENINTSLFFNCVKLLKNIIKRRVFFYLADSAKLIVNQTNKSYKNVVYFVDNSWVAAGGKRYEIFWRFPQSKICERMGLPT